MAVNSDSNSLPTSYIQTEESDELDQSDLVFINSDEVGLSTHLWTNLVTAVQNRKTYACRPQPVRTLKSKGAVLLLVIASLIDISYFGALGAILSALLSDVFDFNQAGVSSFLGIVIVRALPQLAYPIAGWIADVHFDRYKVIMSGLWLLLAGYSIIFVTFLIKYFYNTHGGTYVTYLVVFPISFLIINSGLAAFNANIIPFGLDQMPDASTEQLSAFVHWYYAARNILAGIIPVIPCFISQTDLIFIVHSAAEFLCILLALLLGYGLKRWLVIEPQSENPFRTLYKILKFASQHKVPILRSSFTYWEDKLPKRLDLAKAKYGGPYSTEKVEDVKTVLRVSVVLLTLFGYVIGYYVTLLVSSLYATKLNRVNSGNCTIGYLLLVEVDTLLLVLAVACHELIIHPLFNKFIPSILKRIGLGIIFGIAGTLTLMLIDVYGYRKLTNAPPGVNSTYYNLVANETLCYLVNGESEELIDLPASLVSVPYILVAFSEALLFIAVLEFITAQSPYNMRGVLIGVLYAIRGFFAFVGGVLLLAFSLGYEYHPQDIRDVSCGTPLHVTIFIAGVAGFVCFVIVAKRYKNRIRDEHVNTQAIAEKCYNSIIKNRIAWAAT